MKYGKASQRIVELLMNQEAYLKVNQIGRKVGCSRVTVYNSLRELHRLGLVERMRSGRFSIWAIKRG